MIDTNKTKSKLEKEISLIDKLLFDEKGKEETQETLSQMVSTELEEKVEDVIREREKIKNKSMEQDINLKKETLERLFMFLIWETVGIFILALLQGMKFGGFALEEWSFNILITATLLQVASMVYTAVKHLFPVK